MLFHIELGSGQMIFITTPSSKKPDHQFFFTKCLLMLKVLLQLKIAHDNTYALKHPMPSFPWQLHQYIFVNRVRRQAIGMTTNTFLTWWPWPLTLIYIYLYPFYLTSMPKLKSVCSAKGSKNVPLVLVYFLHDTYHNLYFTYRKVSTVPCTMYIPCIFCLMLASQH